MVGTVTAVVDACLLPFQCLHVVMNAWCQIYCVGARVVRWYERQNNISPITLLEDIVTRNCLGLTSIRQFYGHHCVFFRVMMFLCCFHWNGRNVDMVDFITRGLGHVTSCCRRMPAGAVQPLGIEVSQLERVSGTRILDVTVIALLQWTYCYKIILYVIQ